jgi:hypothetical protein
MPIQFNPPEWLIQEYMRRKSPTQEFLDTAGSIAETYAKTKNAQADRASKQQQAQRETDQLNLARQKEARESQHQGMERFSETADPSGLSPQLQAGMGAVQGPLQPEQDRSNLMPSYDPNNPGDTVLEWARNFRTKYPQGIKGREKEHQAADVYQQTPVLINNKPARFNKPAGAYEIAPVIDPAASQQTVTDPVFTPRVAPPVPAAQTAELGDFENILQELQSVKSTKKPEYIGMVDSRLQAGRQATGIGATPEAATFKASLGAIRNKLLNLLSGAAISPAEYERLLQQLPNEQVSEVDFDAKLNAFEQNIRGVIGNRQKSFTAAGYRPSAQTPPAMASPTTAPAAGGLPSASQARLAELRAKRAAGTLR